MGSLIFIVCFAFMAFYWDFVLRLYRFLYPHRAFDFLNRYMKKMSHRGFVLLSAFTGLRLVVESKLRAPPPRTFILVSNHQSLYDIPALICAFHERDIKFIAKKELSRFVPFVSIGLKMGRHAVISRSGEGSEIRAELHRLARMAKDGYCLHVFPEGTRSRNGEVGRFFTAALHILAHETGLPVLSVALDGGYHMSGLLDMTRAGEQNRYRVSVLSLYTPDYCARRFPEMVRSIRLEIIEQLKAWRRQPKKH